MALDSAAQTDASRAVAGIEATYVDVAGQSLEFTDAPPPSVDDAARHAATSGPGASVLTAPMPGRVIAVRAGAGDAVTAKQPLIVLEAMKMEHAVVAPIDGSLLRITVAVGDQVRRGDVLAEITNR